MPLSKRRSAYLSWVFFTAALSSELFADATSFSISAFVLKNLLFVFPIQSLQPNVHACYNCSLTSNFLSLEPASLLLLLFIRTHLHQYLPLLAPIAWKQHPYTAPCPSSALIVYTCELQYPSHSQDAHSLPFDILGLPRQTRTCSFNSSCTFLSD